MNDDAALKIIGVVDGIYEDPRTQGLALRIKSCTCHLDGQLHLLRLRELPVDEAWVDRNHGKRVEMSIKISIL